MKRGNISTGTALFIIIAAAFISASIPARAAAENTGGESAMRRTVSNMQPGWNLGNTFDATGGETSWGNPVTTKEMIDAIAASGFKSIRIPVTWSARADADYTIRPAAMERVREVVDWALADGMYVVINLHHDSDWLMRMETEYDASLARFKAYWTQIARTFAEYPLELFFESINEPRFSDDWSKNLPVYFEMVDVLNTEFYNIVRSSGGNNGARPLLLPTITCSPEQVRLNELLKTIEKLDDANLIATVHYYGHYHFSVNVGGATAFGPAAKMDIDGLFERLNKTFIERGIPVVIGEYGLLAFDRDVNGVERGEQIKYFNYLLSAACDSGIPMMLWDNGQHFDRPVLTWRDSGLLDIITSNLNGKNSVAERDYIFLKKQDVVSDVSMNVEFNGNELTGITARINGADSERALESPRDYRLEDSKLTFTSGFLLSLPSQPLGTVAVLDVEFSYGPAWQIRVKQYDTPVFTPSANIGASLKIPVAFNGDELITMEAFALRNGSRAGGAGPDSWTPYQQFNLSFTVDYDEGNITLTKDFIQAVPDGEYELRFHFLSGGNTGFYFTKDGVVISGLPEQPAADEQPSQGSAPSAPPSPTPSAQGNNAPPPSSAAEIQDINEGENKQPFWRKPPVFISAGAVLLGAAVTAFIKNRRNKP